MALSSEENSLDNIVKPQARWRWGKRTAEETSWSLWTPNVITTGYAELIGGLLTQANTGHFESPPGTPVVFASPMYMIVGKGDPSWDRGIPTYGPTSLIQTELARKVCQVRGYLPDGATETTTPIAGALGPATIRRPVFSASWGPTELVPPSISGGDDPVSIREVALVGGPNAGTAGLPLQYLVNLLRIAPVVKGTVDPYTVVFECELWINFE
jgi:hypothetical protein